MPFIIIRQDITKIKVDAVVNAANTELQMGGGVCGAIFRAAGARRLQAACDKIAPIQTGGAAITPGFDLQAKYVIHAAGPVYSFRNREQCECQLRSAYMESLRHAGEHGCESIAFPLISSGIYGYPKEEALKVASAAIRDYLADHDMTVYLTVLDRSAFSMSRKLMGEVASYIDEHYTEAHPASPRQLLHVEKEALRRADAPMYTPEPVYEASMPMAQMPGNLDERLKQMDEPFSETLLKWIDAKGKTDVEVYKKANIDRRLFSKIRTGKGYTPKKSTILALAVSLELTLDETDALLNRAGYALSHASKFDVIVEYFIINRKYDIFDINEVLFQYDQPLLGA